MDFVFITACTNDVDDLFGDFASANQLSASVHIDQNNGETIKKQHY